MAKRRGNSNEPLLIGKTTVYVRSNFKKVEPPKDTPEWELPMYENLWEYDEETYPKDKYLQIMAEIVEVTSETLDAVEGYTADLLYEICLLQLGMEDEDFNVD